MAITSACQMIRLEAIEAVDGDDQACQLAFSNIKFLIEVVDARYLGVLHQRNE